MSATPKALLMALLLTLGLTHSANAGTNFFSEIQSKSAKIANTTASLLYEIQDADNNQIKAFEIYTGEYSLIIKKFSEVLIQSNSLIKALQKNFSQKNKAQLEKMIERIDTLLEESHEVDVKIKKLLFSDCTE